MAVTYDGYSSSSSSSRERNGPHTEVVIIGVNKYSSMGFKDLEGACHDAECVAEAFKEVAKTSQRKVIVTKLIDPDADEIRNTIRDVVGRLTKNSLFMLFFSGHGVCIEDHWTYTVPANPQSHHDWIAMEGFIQECIIEKKVEHVRACCFFLCCREEANSADHRALTEPEILDLGETNDYVNVYMSEAGEGFTDWCHAAQAVCYLLYCGEHDLQSFIDKFVEESKYLSLGSVRVPKPNRVRQTTNIFTPPQTTPTYTKIMEDSDLHTFDAAPLLRFRISELTNEALEKVSKNSSVVERISAIDYVRHLLGDICKKMEKLVERKQFESIVSEVGFLRLQKLEGVALELGKMEENEPTLRHLPCECKIPHAVLKAISEMCSDRRRNAWDSFGAPLAESLCALNTYYHGVSIDSISKEAARTQLLQEIVAAFKVEGVSPGSLPQSESSERRLVDELYDVLRETPFRNLADIIIQDIYLIKGSLWILVGTKSTLSKQQVSELQQSLKKVVKTLKRTAPLFAFAKEPKRIPLHTVPSRTLNLVALARQISSIEPQTFGRTSSKMSKGTALEEDIMQERTMPKGTSKLMPKCLPLKASALLAEMKVIFPDRDLRILEHGVEKTQGWLFGTEGLHIVAEKAMAELEWKNAALSEDINAIYKNAFSARCEWCEDDRRIFSAVLFLINGNLNDSNQHNFYPIKQELDMVPFLHGECKSLCEPRRLLQKTMRFICPDGLEQRSTHLVVSWNEKVLSSYAKVVRRVEPDVEVRIVHFARKVPVDISGLCELLQQAKSGSPVMSILFPVTGNGGSQSETNLQLRDVLARHHLQYGFHAVNFVICPTVKEALEAPIEEWKREFAEFAEWSWEIKDSAGTVGLWRGQVDRQREASLVIPASTVGAVLALLAATLTVSTALNIVQDALAFAAALALAAALAIAAALINKIAAEIDAALDNAASCPIAATVAIAAAALAALAVAAALAIAVNPSAAGAQAVSAALAGLAAIVLYLHPKSKQI